MMGDLPIMALHGWLDNSASFNRLIPLLNYVHVLAVDMAGHGRSGHRGNGGYHIWQDVNDVFAIADQMGWQQFALLGHSRGAIISTLSAGTFPNRITHLGLIDGILPPPTPAEEAPQQLAKSVIDGMRAARGSEVLYADKEAAMMARAHSRFPVGEHAAREFVERGTIETEHGVRWTTDPFLKAASGVKLTADQLAAFANAVVAPNRIIMAEQSLPMILERNKKLLEKFPHLNPVYINGGHHLHMDDTVEEVAAVMNELFV